jgi:hypothetical protein
MYVYSWSEILVMVALVLAITVAPMAVLGGYQVPLKPKRKQRKVER